MRRPLIINGFMATGKTTAARLVAEHTGHPWLDLDQVVESAAGKSVNAIFADHGEAHFRRVEALALETALARGDAPIISVGGGALAHRPQRLLAMRVGVVVTLTADRATLKTRLQANGDRPLARDTDDAWLDRMLEQRALAYAEAHAVIRTDGLSPNAVAESVLAVWRRDPLGVAAGHASYSVEVGRHLAPRLKDLAEGASSALLVTDENVGALYGAEAERHLAAATRTTKLVLAPGEEHKNPAAIERIWQHALETGADRGSRFVGLGGGVVTDITGFAAATWMRGVSWLSVSTNLQGMVDASVGGKTAVDLPEAKNSVGAFWQPASVLCDVQHLLSEPDRSYRGALAEVVKTALIGDAALLDLLERERESLLARELSVLEEVVRRCIAVKAAIVSEDEREGGRRAALNLGHTLGHALEAYGGYGHLTHGEAVSLGLVAALGLGEKLGAGSPELSERVRTWLTACGLPTDVHSRPLVDAARLVAHDKKRSGDRVKFVFCLEPGRIEFRSLPLAELPTLVASWLGS
jgi:shikimate kinase / 3-dehydroquinate synthase